VPPTVESVSPPDTAVGNPVTGAVATADFSEALNTATVNVNSFTLTGPAGPVSGTIDLSGTQASFTPDFPLSYNTDYQATLTTEIADLAGNVLEEDVAWSFNTGRKLNANYVGHTCARFDDGRVKCWGYNDGFFAGALGLGDTEERGDEPGEMGDALPAVGLGTDRTALAVAVGSASSCALLDDRSVKCWGNNESGQLGIGDIETRGDEPGEMDDALPAVDVGADVVVLELSVGNAHACVRLVGGSVKCWGDNASGQLGLGDTHTRGDEPGEMGDNLPTVDLGTDRTAVSLTAADRYTCARLDDASLKCWGLNSDGDLGLGDTENRGDAPGEMGDDLPALDLGTGRSVVELASDEHNCGILDDGTLKCWGESGTVGRLGLGDTEDRGDEPGEMGDNLPTVDLGTGRSAAAVTIGSRHSCAILDDGSVKCWGSGSVGKLGQGDGEDRGNEPGEMGDNLPVVPLGTGLTALELTAGDSYSCALLSDGSVKCWGSNFNGVLGLGDMNNRGDEPGEMGDSLPPVDLGT
jgi:alpha-tubulin suppressor-like RCC1 family protein